MLKIDVEDLFKYLDKNLEEIKKKAEADSKATDNYYIRQYCDGMVLGAEKFNRIVTTYFTDKLTEDSFRMLEQIERALCNREAT